MNKTEILEKLHELDNSLCRDTEIILCGSASMLLQDYDFRGTSDIDFCKIPSIEVVKFVGCKYTSIFDLQSTGVIGLLEDYETRLVEVTDNFKHLTVKCLSKVDWAVSKLTSPKLDDVYCSGIITPEDISFIEENMFNYTGIAEYRAYTDLKYIKSRISEKETKEFQ